VSVKHEVKKSIPLQSNHKNVLFFLKMMKKQQKQTSNKLTVNENIIFS